MTHEPIPTEFPESADEPLEQILARFQRPQPTAPIEVGEAARTRAMMTRAGLRLTLDEATEAVAYPAAYGLSEDHARDVEAYEELVRDALAETTDAYLASLPRVPVARDPITNEVVRLAIDTYGLDGPWWKYEGVIRTVDERPETLFAFTGALRLSDTVEPTDHLVKPGTGTPSVNPEVLGRDGMQAVIRSIAIGGHLGWIVTYWCPAAQQPNDLSAPNDWGADHSRNAEGWDSVVEDAEPRDFDLRPWIERGKLAWIAPGDETLTLQRVVAGCPFLDLPGERGVQRVQFGEVWTLASLQTGS